ncbi:hypothetical protein QWI17_22515 [Gilvimarinus sp. SDUM040013]|uniref:Uncharacterized protein n=1 Tax=Gilvimarinus gilvus TaxID=3058038 RepID=A0ABU4RXD9_9GAMM|nr:hypothetical protein [Gilvimarinus sp. SDUM040013]MDO3388637.1 hypothetical protein [Gilvimarinus sp. SDUM040013]MDX6849532.1 hypothetical protein [Gilvimarinus sp. SDUM040013]
MFRFLAKSALATLIWKRYHRPIVATFALLIGYFLVAMIHGDYVDYVKGAADTTYLWLSYLFKWGLLIALTVAYYLYLNRQLRQSETLGQGTPNPAKNTGTKSTATPQSAQDPFAAIRSKRKLKSHADVALDQSKTGNTENKRGSQ